MNEVWVADSPVNARARDGLRLVRFVQSVKELETLPAKVVGSVTPAI